MKIIVAMDSYKGCLTSDEAGRAVAHALEAVCPYAEIICLPVSDGGEGLAQALLRAVGGHEETALVHDPLMRQITAAYTVLPDGTAVIDMASACGLPLLREHERNPLRTTTYGFGDLLRDALRKGCRTVMAGLGGSATNDCGTGMMQALGARFFDSGGHEIPLMCGASLNSVERIDTSGMHALTDGTAFTAACDVDTPLLGPRGATMTFAPQKGATAADLLTLETGMTRIAGILGKHTSRTGFADKAGSGAAGGLGAALCAMLGAELKRGAEIVLDAVHFNELAEKADMVITGEGRSDLQTLMGKLPYTIMKRAQKHALPAMLISGAVDNPKALLDAGFTAVRAVTPTGQTLEEAMKPENARMNIKKTIYELFLHMR